MEAESLSYHDMSLDSTGSIMSKEAKAHRRKQLGYCTTCPGVPVLLIDINRSRFNPLRASKTLRTVPGECFQGKCLRCNPNLLGLAKQNSMNGGSSSFRSHRSLDRMSSHSMNTSLKSINTDSSHSLDGKLLAAPVAACQWVTTTTTTSSSSMMEDVEQVSTHTSNMSCISETRVSSTSMEEASTIRTSLAPAERKPPSRTQSENLLPRHAARSSSSSSSLTLPPSVPRRGTSLSEATESAIRNETLMAASNHSHRSSASSFSVASSVHEEKVPEEEDLVATADLSTSALTRNSRHQLSPRRTHSERLTPVTELPSTPVARRGISLSAEDGSGAVTTPKLVSESSVASFELRSTHESEALNGSSHVSMQTSVQSFGVPDMVEPKPNQEDVVEGLKTLVEAMKDDDDLGVLAEVLISSMDMHRKLESVQLYCLQVMADVFQDTITESTLLVSKIIRAMEDFCESSKIQTVGCRVVKALATNQNNCAVLVQTGACRCICESISRHIGDEATITEAITALRMISVSDQARKILQRLSASNDIAQAMRCNPMKASIQRDGCALLSNLAVDPERRSVSQLSSEELEAVVGALESHARDQEVVSIACFALKNFTYDDSNLRNLRLIENIFVILQEAVGSNSSDDAYVVLERVQMSRAEDESLEEQIHESLLVLLEIRSNEDGIVLDVVDIMMTHKWSARVTAACVRALKCLASTAKIHKDRLKQEDVYSNLTKLVDSFESNAQVAQEARSLFDVISDECKDDPFVEAAEVGSKRSGHGDEASST